MVLYHTARNSITLLLDAVPIYAFILYSLYLVLSELLNDKLRSLLVLVGFVVLEILISMYVPREFLNGSIRHLTAVLFIIIIGWIAYKKYGKSIVQPLVNVVVLYLLAITFRSIDSWICTWIPVGTHFLWHILTAFAGYYAINLIVILKLKN